MRKVDQPERRFQDHTEELLCANCEQVFNQYESPFAGRVFHPYMNGNKDSFECGDWLHQFIISVNWRLIISELSIWENLPDYGSEAVEDAREIWFDILAEKLNVEHDPYTHHVIFLDALDLRTNPGEWPDKWEFYRDRATDATVIRGRSVETHYYFKFPRIAFITCIQPPSVPGFRNTQVTKSGEIGPPQSVPPDWESFFLNRAGRAFSYELGEEERVTEWIMDRPERAVESETFKTWNESMMRRIENHDPTDYLDQDCPVCFTQHRVIDFLPERPITESETDGFRRAFEEEFEGELVCFKPIFLQGELEHPDLPNNISPTIVLSTGERTAQIALYSGFGWVVEKEIDLSTLGETDPREMAEALWDSTYADYVEFAEKHG